MTAWFVQVGLVGRVETYAPAATAEKRIVASTIQARSLAPIRALMMERRPMLRVSWTCVDCLLETSVVVPPQMPHITELRPIVPQTVQRNMLSVRILY